MFHMHYMNFNKKGKMKCNVKVEDFLSLIKNATYVVQFFSCNCFFYYFNTQFMIVFPEKYSTRVKSILEITNLQSRIVDDYNDVSLANYEVDFDEANKILAEERRKAIGYFDEVLKS